MANAKIAVMVITNARMGEEVVMDSDEKIFVIFAVLAMGWIPICAIGYWVYEIAKLFL